MVQFEPMNLNQSHLTSFKTRNKKQTNNARKEKGETRVNKGGRWG